jgi:hypothetical protein
MWWRAPQLAQALKLGDVFAVDLILQLVPVMHQALTNPERSSYGNMQRALERCKMLRGRYD